MAGSALAHRVGEPHAFHACIERALQKGDHVVPLGTRDLWIVQPKAVLMPTSMRVFELAASRAARMAAIVVSISSGVLRTLAALCARLADIGISIECAPTSMARSATFEVRYQHRVR